MCVCVSVSRGTSNGYRLGVGSNVIIHYFARLISAIISDAPFIIASVISVWFHEQSRLLRCILPVFTVLDLPIKVCAAAFTHLSNFAQPRQLKSTIERCRDIQSLRVTTDFTRSSVTRSFLLKAAEICILVIRNWEEVRVKNFYSLTEKNSLSDFERQWLNLVSSIALAINFPNNIIWKVKFYKYFCKNLLKSLIR